VWISALRIDSNKTVLRPIYWKKGVMAPAGIITFFGDDSVKITVRKKICRICSNYFCFSAEGEKQK
jgi:hypothetical protein